MRKVRFAVLFGLLLLIPQLSIAQPHFGAISGRGVWQTEEHPPLEECVVVKSPMETSGFFSGNA